MPVLLPTTTLNHNNPIAQTTTKPVSCNLAALKQMYERHVSVKRSANSVETRYYKWHCFPVVTTHGLDSAHFLMNW